MFGYPLCSSNGLDNLALVYVSTFFWATPLENGCSVTRTHQRYIHVNTSNSSDPITHVRDHQLNYQVTSLLSFYPSYLDYGDACTLVLVRNQGDDRKGKGFAQAGFGLLDSSNL